MYSPECILDWADVYTSWMCVHNSIIVGLFMKEKNQWNSVQEKSLKIENQ